MKAENKLEKDSMTGKGVHRDNAVHIADEILQSSHLLLNTQADNLSRYTTLSPVMQKILSRAKKVAAANVPVLLTGESGTGKEIFARYIHQCSDRQDEGFVAINCAAIPESMLESILFGHEKGAFTGAYQAQVGQFEQANGGTLLLDEISEMSLDLQAKLLRVIQEKEVQRLGSQKNIPLNIRLIATSNRDIAAAVKDKVFREDLFYRLNVFPLDLPPLRNRKEDIKLLTRYFLTYYSYHASGADFCIAISAAAEKKLQQYHWPGNIRELENVIQRAIILQEGGCIESSDIELDCFDSLSEEKKVIDDNEEDSNRIENKKSLEEKVKKYEFELIAKTLQKLCGNKQATAEQLKISPRTLRYKMAEMRQQGCI